MLSIVLVCLGAMAADEVGGPAGKSPADVAAYEAAAGKAGKDPAAHVRLALWCEAHGMTAERMKHLAAAVAADPSHAMARGLMGLVSYKGQWQRPDDVSREAKDDPDRQALMQEYLERRAKTPETADGQYKLAEWCEQKGLKAQAEAHFQRVIRLDPRRESAWKHLGFRKSGGRWIKPEEVAAARTRAQEQNRANRHWKPILDRYRVALQSKSPTRRADAEQALSRITEPDAVPTVWAVLGRGEPMLQKAAVQVLGQIDDGGASRALVLLSVFGGSPEVRRQATETLRRRDAREFGSMLIGMILEPIEFEVKRVQGPGQGGELLIKGQGSAPNLRRLYSPPAPAATVQPGDRITYDENGLPVAFRPEAVGYIYMTGAELNAMGASGMQTMQPTAQFRGRFIGALSHMGLGAAAQKVGNRIINQYESGINLAFSNPLLSPNPLVQAAAMYPAGIALNPGSQITLQVASGEMIPVGQMALEARKSAMVAEQQLENDVAALREYNQSLSEINDRVLPVLKAVSGLDIGPKPVEWQKWFVNLVGYRLNQMQASEKTTVIEDVPLAYQPAPIPIGQMTAPVGLSRVSCFGAGTPVRTLTGIKPIEQLKVGDPVLAQSTRTGALAYQPILAVHHNPPGRTFRVNLGGETIVSSEFHRFWVAGRGWVMARDLKAGDRVRTLDGPVEVASIEPGEVVLVYNLDVAEDHDFFVGQGGALVHDNTLPDLREKPFDAVGPLATARAPAPPSGPRRSVLGR